MAMIRIRTKIEKKPTEQTLKMPRLFRNSDKEQD